MIHTTLPAVVTVVAIFVLTTVAYVLWRRRERVAEGAAQRDLVDLAGLGEVAPPTRYPKIDPDRCVGSGGCVNACPEEVLQIVEGRAVLVNPLGCVGHGACASACGFSAISLVYGTKNIAVELPKIDANFETNRPGIYIVGELSGMALISNAVSQGRRAADRIAAGSRRGTNGAADCIVVGAGPAGISATLGLMKAGLRVVTIDREKLGGTILHFPRAKVVMAGNLELPLYGRVNRRTMKKEELVGLWHDIRQKTGIRVEEGEVVTAIAPEPDGMWKVVSNRAERRAANVVLALGGRGAPRKLEVEGEDQAKVVYRVIEPEVFADQHVLVVGGGNSAVETALALAQSGGCKSVALSYRRDQFARCRGDNKRNIEDAIRTGRVRAFLPSTIKRIDADSVTLEMNADLQTFANDAVVAQVGGIPPSELLASFGIELVQKRGQA